MRESFESGMNRKFCGTVTILKQAIQSSDFLRRDMLRFIDDTYDLNSALSANYDYLWVAVSFLVACLAAYTAWTMADNLKFQKGKQAAWHVGGSVAMGCGIWCMHFVGMLAFELPVLVTYDLWLTLGSMVPAIVASSIAIYQFGQPKMLFNRVAACALFMGAGVGCMHYIGMAAMRVNAVMAYELDLFILSVVVAVVLAFIALSIKFVYQKMAQSGLRNWYKFLSIVVMGLSISGMHYTAMAAVFFFPANESLQVGQVISNNILSLLVLAFTLLLLLLTLVATVVEHRLRSLSNNLEASRKRMVDAIESISEGFVMFDKDDRLIMANSVYQGMYPELKEGMLPGVSYKELIQQKAQWKQDGGLYVEKRLAWSQASATPFEEAVQDGRQFLGRECRSMSGDLIGVWSDISEIKKVNDKLTDQKAQLRQILDISPVAIFIQSISNNQLLYANTAGYNLNLQLKLCVDDKVTSKLLQCAEYRSVKQHAIDRGAVFDKEVSVPFENQMVSLLLSATEMEFENQACLLFTLIDISERKETEEQLRVMATIDSLSQLNNRRHFMELSHEHLSRCVRNQLPLSVCMLDIDHFKQVNDNYSHATGDEVIQAVAAIMMQQVRDGDVVGRLGGEEFAVVLADKDLNTALVVAERIRKAVAESSFVSAFDETFQVTISIGISSLANRELNVEVLLAEADHALYRAKNGGRNQTCVHEIEETITVR